MLAIFISAYIAFGFLIVIIKNLSGDETAEDWNVKLLGKIFLWPFFYILPIISELIKKQ